LAFFRESEKEKSGGKAPHSKKKGSSAQRAHWRLK
jgi:hypothetical protein